jgi:hypothetical protein
MERIAFKDINLKKEMNNIKHQVKDKIGKEPSNSQLLTLLVKTYNEVSPDLTLVPRRKREIKIKW